MKQHDEARVASELGALIESTVKRVLREQMAPGGLLGATRREAWEAPISSPRQEIAQAAPTTSQAPLARLRAVGAALLARFLGWGNRR